MNQEELASLSASETVQLVRSKQVSPVETTQAAIDRIEKLNPVLNAVIYTDFDGAKQKARDLEQRIMRDDTVGGLAGVPTLMKDLFDFRPGWPSTLGGIPALKDFVPDFWSTFPKHMEREDAILIGKTNTPVMGFNGATDNPLFGATCNPFDLDRNSGGSSGGSAAAVAGGLVPVAGASDGGGSIRIPASWCGVAGFQPSYGRVPMVLRPNAFGALSPFVYEGPVARCVDDLALVMNALAGYDAGDPFSNPEQVDFLSCLKAPSLKGKRIGYTRNFGIFPVEAAVQACTDKAVSAFTAAGAQVDEINLDIPFSQQELSDLWCRLISAGSCAMVTGLQQRGIDLLGDYRSQLPDWLVYWIGVVSRQSFADMQADQVMRTKVFDAFANAFSGVDLIVSPTTAALPVKNLNNGLTTGPSSINGVAINPQIGWCMTYLTNLIGHPAASVPAGLSDGLPVGLQIIGRRYADTDVMQACACFERERPWAAIYESLKTRPGV
jgi:amidase/aspartyl-tRNA(Asn)/glutamyl-tRNA(Gln) amidotransferase subunit A